MNTIRIENLRKLRDTGTIEIKPINILVGQNSSGKSTFLRTFPLIRQSVEERIIGPILWYGKLVDFGSFKEAVNKSNNNKEEINLHFNFNSNNIENNNYFFRKVDFNENVEISVCLSVVGLKKYEGSRVGKVKINIGDNEIEIGSEENNKLDFLKINGINYTEYIENEKQIYFTGIIPSFRLDRKIKKRGILFNNYTETEATIKLANYCKVFFRANTSEENITSFTKKISIGNKKETLKKLQEEKIYKSFNKKCMEWTVKSKEFEEIISMKILESIEEIIDIINEYFREYFKNVYYIAPIRATAERYYRMQDLAIDEVDFQGRNLPMVLKNLSQNKEEMKAFQEWCAEKFDFYPVVNNIQGHVSINIHDCKEGAEVNLADTGFGYSQILPIITQLWKLCEKSVLEFSFFDNRVTNKFILVIEQPELHLHPKMQAKLAKAFASAIKVSKEKNIELKIILETHSDMFINAFGHMVEEKEISEKDIVIVIFEKDIKNETVNTKITKYDSEGYLEKWPIGFFEGDEL